MSTNYMPYSYQNYGYQPQRTMQPQYQMPVQQAQQLQMQQSAQFEYPLQYVGNGTQKEAEGYIIFPNQKGIFFDKANGMVYEKITYNDGQSFIIEYKKVDNETDKQTLEIAKEEKPLEIREFAKKTDLKDFITVEQYKELKEMFDGLQGQINGLKQSFKKTVKEQEKGENNG